MGDPDAVISIDELENLVTQIVPAAVQVLSGEEPDKDLPGTSSST